MTKKKEQPRDGNGKFIKKPCIALHDKGGSTAFFTSVEEMEKFTKNNGIAVASKSEKNPDCEPATKGYVKSLIGKTRDHDHTHISTWDGTPTLLAMFSGCLGSTLLGASCISVSETARNLGNQYFVPVLLFTIVMFCVFYEFRNFEIEEIKTPLPSELQKYTPPRKDECEEE
jgi:hypothetical protein